MRLNTNQIAFAITIPQNGHYEAFSSSKNSLYLTVTVQRHYSLDFDFSITSTALLEMSGTQCVLSDLAKS